MKKEYVAELLIHPGQFLELFRKHRVSSTTSEDILAFMSKVSGGNKQNTKKLRFSLWAAFFNFIKNSIDPYFQNPCDNPALCKLVRAGKPVQLTILEKDMVDEIIFRTQNPRYRRPEGYHPGPQEPQGSGVCLPAPESHGPA